MADSPGDGVAPEREPVTLTIPGLAAELVLLVHGEVDRFVSRQLREHGVWEPFETRLVMACLGPGDVFLDVGANIGYFSILAAQCVGAQGRVWAFEPDPANCALMRASVARNGFEEIVVAEEAALSDHTGTGVLYLSEDNLGDHQVFGSGGGRARRDIRLLHGAEHLARHGVRPGLVKIDTQGSEYAVVTGLMPLLRTCTPDLRLLIELTPFSLRAAGASGRALVTALEELALPFWIVDHIEHRLVPTSAAALCEWCDNVDAVPGDEGFMNIFLGSAPAELAGTVP